MYNKEIKIEKSFENGNKAKFTIINKTEINLPQEFYNKAIEKFCKQTIFHNDLESYLWVFDFLVEHNNTVLWVESRKISNELDNITLQIYS
jgi:hypothetical protein